jgi:hypothetical protein
MKMLSYVKPGFIYPTDPVISAIKKEPLENSLQAPLSMMLNILAELSVSQFTPSSNWLSIEIKYQIDPYFQIKVNLSQDLHDKNCYFCRICATETAHVNPNWEMKKKTCCIISHVAGERRSLQIWFIPNGVCTVKAALMTPAQTNFKLPLPLWRANYLNISPRQLRDSQWGDGRLIELKSWRSQLLPCVGWLLLASLVLTWHCFLRSKVKEAPADDNRQD